MSNRRKRLEKQKTVVESRRSFLKKGLAGILTTVSGRIVGEEKLAQNYGEWYQQNMVGRGGEWFTRDEFVKHHEPSVEDLEREEKKFREIAGPNAVIIGKKDVVGKGFRTLNVSERTFEEYEIRSDKVIREFIDFVGVKGLPELEFRRFTRNTPLVELTRNKLFYFVCDTIAENSVISIIKFLEEGVQRGATLVSGKSMGGYVAFREGIYYEGGKFIIKSKSEGPIMVSTGISQVLSYSVPASETLHFLLHQNTLRRIEDSINKKVARIGRLISPDDPFLWEDLVQGHYLEEGVVHAAMDIFLEKNAKREGMLQNELEELRVKQNGSERYSLVPKYTELMRRDGVAKVVQDYLHGRN